MSFIRFSDFAGFSGSPFGHLTTNGPYRRGIFYSATDAQGNYNGVTRVLSDQTITFKVNSKGYVKERHFNAANQYTGTTFWEYADCD